jgi:hypothetical protein
LSSYLLRYLKTKIHKTIILPLVLYRCEVWSSTLSEEHRLRVSKNNRLLRGILASKREKGVGDWDRLHNEELCMLHQIFVG